jgi:hypothetical protein
MRKRGMRVVSLGAWETGQGRKGTKGWGQGEETPREKSTTHDVGTLGLEGVGTTDVQVGGIVWLQEADEVETLCL